jgi:SAM-dependent methyltransferase
MKPIDSYEIYENGRYYDQHQKEFVEDISFYITQAETFGDPILELACGTGRIAIPIAERGFDISGIDVSEGMLNQARAKIQGKELDVDFIHADIRNFELDKTFNLIIFAYNSLAHIHDLESFEALCDSIKRHLAPDGRFIVDMFVPKMKYFVRESSNRYPVTEFPNPDGDGTVVISENNVYDNATQINHVKWYYRIGDAPEQVRELNMRIYFPRELEALLTYNGFQIERKYGDFQGNDFTSESPKQILVCKQR